ncbi:ATP-dependent DNA ligase [Sphingobacterium sp. SGR-19]|uniref:ATP-dependent DNA ligase n=1 Tax=Sphingobacterium sp. SGR-19 TaxID=2710886 RepID=UPI0013EAC782|nr:ATP-dependent DNA ligase [Sphingobacterium sp. SGR-19]NGM66738.1 ATP-dependent DNA ligase [Sphingobacterium sp. SGR-19]
MRAFATLINTLDSTNKTNLKLEAIDRFLHEADNDDKLWFLALFTGKRPKRNVNTALMKQWAIEVAAIPEWLFQESYASVGDLGETIALVLPQSPHYIDRTLTEWMNRIIALKDRTEAEKKEFVLLAWNNLPTTERFIFNKLLGGSFRLGVSSKTLINALAKHYQMDASAVAHSVMGDWKMGDVTFDDLIKGHYTDTQLSKPYPFCLAYPLEKELNELGDVQDWQIEYKWDGIRGQFIKRNDEVFIWSRGEELVTDQFPEIRDNLLQWQGNFVIDGEILVVKEQEVMNFSALQKRLNRKTISKKLLEEFPIQVYAYDLIEWEGEDWRHKSMLERRQQLESLFLLNPSPHLQLSTVITIDDWEVLQAIRENARSINSEGIMLKHKASLYHTGRKKGDWWKWKIDPLTIDAVLIYAQKGSGRRSAYYTDYTFAVRDGENLVTIAKAYSGLTDKEIKEVSRFVNKNAIEKFGPVRTVKPELVFEIAFEGIAFSNRHKSGVALRFPRIARWRTDKTVADIDDIEEIKKMIH